MWRFILFTGLMLTASPAMAIGWLVAAAPFLAAASAAATVAGTVLAYGAAKDQAKAQKKLQKQAAIKAARDRMQQIREARIRTAGIEQSGQAAGVATSSGVQGGVSGVQSQLGSNLNFMDVTQTLGQQATDKLASAADKTSLASIVGAVGTLTDRGAKYGLAYSETKKDV